MRKDVLIKISGRVQGVFYRVSAKEQADTLQVEGWIKNEPDETVTAYVSGDEENVQAFINWCRTGPPGAQVEDIKIENCAAQSVNGFGILR